MRVKSIPTDLGQRIEAARLDTLALMRAIDQCHMGDHLSRHPALLDMYELDADCGEALVVLRERPSGIDWKRMVRDTEASLTALPAARERVRAALAPDSRTRLRAREPVVRAMLDRADAYIGIDQ